MKGKEQNFKLFSWRPARQPGILLNFEIVGHRPFVI